MGFYTIRKRLFKGTVPANKIYIVGNLGTQGTDRGHPDLGHFPRSGEMKNFKTGEIPQNWGNGKFLINFL